jgi:hypothetical protein
MIACTSRPFALREVYLSWRRQLPGSTSFDLGPLPGFSLVALNTSWLDELLAMPQ